MSNNRYAYIEALRTVAAILVVWIHASEVFLKPSKGRLDMSAIFDISYYLDFGRIRVVLFFIISGFVIPSSLKRAKVPSFRSFAIK